MVRFVLSPVLSHLVFAGASIALALAPASAQSNPQLVGITRYNPFSLTQDVATCATTSCPLGIAYPLSIAPSAGGSAYDESDRLVFHSNGLVLTTIDPRAGSCAPECPIVPVPNTSPSNAVTGLAYNSNTTTLFVTDAANVIRWYSVGNGCQLSLISRCTPAIPGGSFLFGCATDDVSGLLFYGVTSPSTRGGTVFVTSQSSPCTTICSFFIGNCGTTTMGALSGLAYDACRSTLWVTDSRETTARRFDPITCTLRGETQCCRNSNDRFMGLTVLPSTETSSGSSCTGGTCPNCPAMAQVLGSDPTMGSPFTMRLDDAPQGSPVWLLVQAGACVAGPGLLSPPLCGGIRVPFVPLSIGPFFTPGAPGGCNGDLSLTFAIPPDPSLCNVPLSSQFLGLCGAFTGTFVSNCLSWTI